MSKRNDSHAYKIQRHADTFAALGDPTRLTLMSKLGGGRSHSISELTEGTRITRQAVTKHLQVLENIGVVHSTRTGRESLYKLDPKPIESLQKYLLVISAQWDQALKNLKTFIEKKRQD